MKLKLRFDLNLSTNLIKFMSFSKFERINSSCKLRPYSAIILLLCFYRWWRTTNASLVTITYYNKSYLFHILFRLLRTTDKQHRVLEEAAHSQQQQTLHHKPLDKPTSRHSATRTRREPRHLDCDQSKFSSKTKATPTRRRSKTLCLIPLLKFKFETLTFDLNNCVALFLSKAEYFRRLIQNKHS